MVQSVDYNAITINDRMESKMKNLLTIKNYANLLAIKDMIDLSNEQIVNRIFEAIHDDELAIGFETDEDYCCVIANDEESVTRIEKCKIHCTKEDCKRFLEGFDGMLAKIAKTETEKITGAFAGEVVLYVNRINKLIELGAPQVIVRNEQISLLVYSFLNEYTLLRNICRLN